MSVASRTVRTESPTASGSPQATRFSSTIGRCLPKTTVCAVATWESAWSTNASMRAALEGSMGVGTSGAEAVLRASPAPVC